MTLKFKYFSFFTLCCFLQISCMEQAIIFLIPQDQTTLIAKRLNLLSLSRFSRTCQTAHQNFNIDSFGLANPSFLHNLDKYDYISALKHYATNWIPTKEERRENKKSIKEIIFEELLNDKVNIKNKEIRRQILRAIPYRFYEKKLDDLTFNHEFYLHTDIAINNSAFGLYHNDRFSFTHDPLNLWIILKVCHKRNTNDHAGNTILHAACQENNLKAAQIITEKKFVDINRKTIALVAPTGRTDIQEETININKGNGSGNTPLHLACCADYPITKLIKLLLDHGALINVQNKKGNLPIHLATKNNNFIFVKFLLEQGSASNIPNFIPKGNLPLHIAVENNTFMIAKILFEHNPAAAITENHVGLTPLDLAYKQNNRAIICLFEGRKCDTLPNSVISSTHFFLDKGKIFKAIFGLATIAFISYCYKKLSQ